LRAENQWVFIQSTSYITFLELIIEQHSQQLPKRI